jgi:hypothetical protein
MATLNVSEKPTAASSSTPSLLPLPITPYASINTNWSDVASAGFATCVAAAPDSLSNSQDTIWVGAASGGVMTYSIVNAAWANVATDAVLALTALSATEAYAAPASGGPLIHYLNGQSSTLPAFPNNDIVAELASAPDGTLWAASANGCYLWNGSSWTTTNTNGYALNALATTGAGGAWAVGNLATLLVYSPTEGWQPVEEFSEQIISSVGAAPDGSVWIAGTGSQPYQVLQSDSSWVTVPMQSPGDLALSRMSAASGYRCYVVWFSGFLTIQISCLSFGIVDQLATQWPAMTASQSALYTAISQFLLTPPAGEQPPQDAWDIRSHYNDSLANLTTWYTNLKTESWSEFIAAYPGAYTEQDWNILQPQLLTELSYAEEVNTLFGNINGLAQSIQGDNNGNLQSMPGMVGLSQPSGSDGDNTAIVVLGGILDALMWGLAALGGVPELPELGFALSAGASMFGTGIDLLGGGPPSPGDRSQQITTTYYQVTQTLNAIYTNTATASGNGQASIVGDWGMLNLVGNCCFTGLWTWPDQASSQISSYAQNAFQIWFFQVLMTAKWEVVYVMWSNESGSWNNRTADYLTYTEPNIGMGGTDTYFCVEIGGDDDYWNPPEMGPFPSEVLMNAIWALGVQKADFFKNQNGWNNPVDDAA